MDCREARELLLTSAKGQVDERARAHVDSCAACREELRRHEEVWKLLLALPAVEPRPDFSRGVRERVYRRPNRILRIIAPLTAAAAALAIVFFSAIPARPPSPPMASIESELKALTPEDRALFEALNEGETWELAEHLDEVGAIDVVSDPAPEEEK